MRVSELAESLSITPETVRYYTRLGYLAPKKSPNNGYREYDEKDQQRLRFILSARQLGFSVTDIGKILSEADQGKSPCCTTRQLMEKRLEETEQQFQEMVKLRNKMKAAVAQWYQKPNKQPNGQSICHLIEEFSDQSVEELTS